LQRPLAPGSVAGAGAAAATLRSYLGCAIEGIAADVLKKFLWSWLLLGRMGIAPGEQDGNENG